MEERTLRKLEFDKVRDRLAACCACALGRYWVEKLRPLHDPEVIRARLAETSEARALLDDRAVPFGGIRDVREEVERARPGGMLNALELLAVAETLRGAEQLRNALTADSGDFPHIRALADRIGSFGPLVARIARSIDEEGRVVDGASEELARLRLRARRLTEAIDRTIGHMLANPEVQRALQDRLVTIRRDRPCIPVRSDSRRAVTGVVHDISASGATLFIEPSAAVEQGDELHRVRMAEEEEILRILRDLSKALAERYEDAAETIRVVSILDFIFARARLSLKMDAVEPEIVGESRIVLVHARHPLIPRDQVVPVDLWIGEEFDLLLITGPNTGGKTVAIKTAGLLSLMAMSGLHIPADEGSKVPVLRGVYADIGDEQSIEQNLSTFSSHVTHIARIVRRARRGSLVLLDEIGAGTDPEEGSALAVAVLRHLGRKGVLVIATTHYNALKTFALNEPRAENACVDFDPETLRPTYRLLIGTPGSSNALTIAERIGLPRPIVEMARSVMPSERLRVEDAIREMERSRRAYDEQRGVLEHTRREMEHEAERHSTEADELERRRKQAVREGWAEAQQIVAQARHEALKILADLREQPREGRATQESQQQLAKLQEVVAEAAARATLEPQTAGGDLDLLPGDVVRVRSIGQRGIVLSEPDDAGRIQVAVGTARMDVPIGDVEALDGAEDLEIRTNARELHIVKSLTVPREIMLRGLTVDEALLELERFMDDAALAQHDRIYVIHGRGTGALREAVRNYLRHCPLAASFEYAPPDEGGIGVTVVHM